MSISHTGEGARSHTPALARGMRDGIPVGLGYLAVAFSLGIAARNAGLNAFQGFLVSLLNNASAGEYAGFTTIAADATYLEIAIDVYKRQRCTRPRMDPVPFERTDRARRRYSCHPKGF